jgi:hypothetical protein
LSAAIRHSSGGWNPGDEPNNLDTGLRRYDVKLFLEIESLILGLDNMFSIILPRK